MESAKAARKRGRQLQFGFQKPEEADEDGNVPPNPLIEEDPEDFDKEAYEKELIRKVFDDTSRGLIIDGTWNNFAEELGVTATEGGAFINLLTEARRPPEIVVVLKCNEKSAKDRMIDDQGIKGEFDRLMEARNKRLAEKRAEDRAVKLEEVTAE